MITWFSRGKEGKGIGSQQIIRWGGGLDKIECQLTANERG